MRRKTVSKNTLNAFFLCLFSPIWRNSAPLNFWKTFLTRITKIWTGKCWPRASQHWISFPILQEQRSLNNLHTSGHLRVKRPRTIRSTPDVQLLGSNGGNPLQNKRKLKFRDIFSFKCQKYNTNYSKWKLIKRWDAQLEHFLDQKGASG